MSDTARERAHRLLATTEEPLTTAAIAERLDCTPSSARKGLKQLERDGRAQRVHGPSPQAFGRPDLWTAVRT
jgi:predicted ArsR family transcriptional regulator